MNTEPTIRRAVSKKSLWFGFAGAVVAWVLAGVLNVLLAWQACMGGEAGSGMFTQTGIHVVLGIISIVLLVVAIGAGVVSYRNWKIFSDKSEFIEAEGRERHEFMAMVGVVVSTSMAMGLLWFVLPIYIVQFCVRAR